MFSVLRKMTHNVLLGRRIYTDASYEVNIPDDRSFSIIRDVSRFFLFFY